VAEDTRLLLVEPEPEARHVLMRLLGRFGTPSAAATLAAAVQALAADNPEVLLLDPDLPDGDGMTLISAVRAQVPWAQVFILGSESREGDVGWFIDSGANDVIIRPFDVAAFLPRVERLCKALCVRKEEFERLAQLESRLRHVDGLAMLGTLMATLAHEVAGPLSVIRTNADFLRADLLSAAALDEDKRKDLASIAGEMDQAGQAIHTFITRIRGASRRNTADAEEASLAPAIDTALLFLKQRITLSRVAISVPNARDCPVVSHVPHRLVQALVNAMSNAMEATGPGGRVVVRCSEEPTRVLIEIEDDGPGLSQEARNQALEPFFTTKPSGTGLGMSVIQDVMQEHGGKLELADAPSGKGLCVRMLLPRRRGPIAAP
jgi:two-component system, NtrC family, sensor histidine kinase HydH